MRGSSHSRQRRAAPGRLRCRHGLEGRSQVLAIETEFSPSYVMTVYHLSILPRAATDPDLTPLSATSRRDGRHADGGEGGWVHKGKGAASPPPFPYRPFPLPRRELLVGEPTPKPGEGDRGGGGSGSNRLEPFVGRDNRGETSQLIRMLGDGGRGMEE
jgi:hypothetical protein